MLEGAGTQTPRLEQSVAPIPGGTSRMIGGVMAVGTPERGIDEIVRQSKCGPTRRTIGDHVLLIP
jgi:acyl CoA:acetate/3-ketoacid CoA transferase alpha subunit